MLTKEDPTVSRKEERQLDRFTINVFEVLEGGKWWGKTGFQFLGCE